MTQVTQLPHLTQQRVMELVTAFGGPVLVVDGEDDYHVDECPQLPEDGVEEIDVTDARADGFRACRTCRPNRVLAEEALAEQEAGVRAAAVHAEAERAAAERAAAERQPAWVPTPLAPVPREPPPVGRQFVFDGGAGTYVGTAVLALLITVLTLGFAYPFALVLRERWRAKHSFVNGQRLVFTGSATGLLGLWIRWFLLSIVTLGVYLFWVGPRIARWKWQHTGFENQVVVRPVE